MIIRDIESRQHYGIDNRSSNPGRDVFSLHFTTSITSVGLWSVPTVQEAGSDPEPVVTLLAWKY
jgi:hypothetical protein